MSIRRGVVNVAVCVAVAGAGWLALVRPASAHHSFALFDHVHRITVAGTVVKFDWSNPHVYIHLAVPDGAGTRAYTVECASPNVLIRVGWKYGDIKVGDRVSLLVNPLRDGKAGGMLERATLADGRTMSDGNPPGGVFPIERQLPAHGSAR
jgi:Family of unknown function (DUF6152)